MNREDGFSICDVDVNMLHDPKMIALARATRDERLTAVHVTLYVALVLQSWAAGDRVTLDEALPAWWMGSPDESRAALQSVGLIDGESRVPVTAWESWFVPAFDRRERRRESGAEGGRRSWQSRRDKRRFSDASATPNPSVLPAGRHSDRPAGRGDTQSPTNGVGASDLRSDASATLTCDMCHEPLVGEPWEPRKRRGGRMANIHARCLSSEALVAS